MTCQLEVGLILLRDQGNDLKITVTVNLYFFQPVYIRSYYLISFLIDQDRSCANL